MEVNMLGEHPGKNQQWIDFFKGIAICGIVYTHAGGGGWIGTAGAYGVQMFFIISLYLACHSLTGKSCETSLRYMTIIRWFLNRIWRLTPLYYISLTAYIIMLPPGMNIWLGSSSAGVTWNNIVAHLLYIHNLFPYYANSIMWIEWYLGVLMLFYLILPVTLKCLRNLKAVVVFTLVTICLSIMITGFLMKLHPLKDQYIWDGWVSTYSMIRQFPAFSVALLLYWLERSFEKINLSYVFELSGCLCFIIAVVLYWIFNPHLLHVSLIAVISLSFGLILLGVIFSQRESKSICILEPVEKILNMIGRHCYGIYLFHYLIILYLGKVIDNAEVKFGLTMFIAIVIAVCYDNTVGEKINTWGRNKINGDA